MSYYNILGLDKEPFSTSPDPNFFYQFFGHKAVLYRLRVAIELRRGLSLILGDIGAGKTTLSRILFQIMAQEENSLVVPLLNPVYESEKQFLADLLERFHATADFSQDKKPSTLAYLKTLERILFQKCVEEHKTVVLLIDEAQKLTEPCLEVLRSLLNYETNEYKILQVVLLSQMELLPRISSMKNLWDRISLKYVLSPPGESEIKGLIEYRLAQAGYVSGIPLFKDDAIQLIYQHTQGCLRKITMLCHDAMEHLVMHNQASVTAEVVMALLDKEVKPVLV